MESEDGAIVQRVEKVILRRKLTGPPRLLLPSRTRTRRTDRHKTRTNNIESSQVKIDQDVSSAVHEGNSRGRCEAAEEGDEVIRNRRAKRHRWWRRFTPELECVRRQRRKDEHVPPEELLHVRHDTAPQVRKDEEKRGVVAARRSRFKVKTWSRIRRMQDFLSRGWRKRRRSTVEEMEETQQSEEVECPPGGLTIEGSVEVTVEVSDKPPGGVQTCDLKKEEEEKEEKGEQTDDAPEEDVVVLSSEGSDCTSSHFLLPNGPSILIQLVPHDEGTLDDEEDEVWELSTSSEKQNLLLLLLATEPGERQLLQTARSLVRAAMSAAVDQLSREQSQTNCLEGHPEFTLMAERSKVNI